MHSLPNKGVILRFRIAAWLLLMKWMLTIACVSVFLYSMAVERQDLTRLSLGLLVLALVVSVGHWVVAGKACCPLCYVPSFSHKGCSKNRKARHFLGSYRLCVALSVVFRGRFHCPYCGEPTAMEVRRSRRAYRPYPDI